MKTKSHKHSTRAELMMILEKIYRSLKQAPISKKKLRPIPLETDWNWHYNY